ncbi:MAG: carboxypeptidase regulatory-like domain-containing protein [Gemmatimonadetes bacterium]|nr:carboxypeptidase regulatory-like domain-containing protein [Gemmatimonadota bacterium]
MRSFRFWLILGTLLPLAPDVLAAQVTTATISGVVASTSGARLSSATVVAVHEPSGTVYSAITRADGRYTIPGVRVGGPYRVTVTIIGYEEDSRVGIYTSLGVSTDVDFALREQAVALEGITVSAERDAIFSAERTGAATTVTRAALATLPTISGRLESITRLTPQAGGGLSFAGQDSRLNNITIDGSYFNNSFGLGNSPGERTGVAAISLAALEEVQVSVAPFDVRQGNFVGAGINSVTRSGNNDYSGSIYYRFRDDGLVGTDARGAEFNPGTFEETRFGVWLSGPIIRDRLFFFGSFEDEGLTQPGTTFRANTGSETVGGSITRVKASDLDALSSFLASNFEYETGPYQGYDHETPARRYLATVDYNLNDRHKLRLRYNHLDSNTDVLVSNSSSLGFGTRRTNTNGLNFRNSNYQILENIRSIVGEWNAIIGRNMANQFIAGYTYHDESRASRGTFFPMVDVLDQSTVYTTFGFEPFTPNNELRYSSYQLQNNFTVFAEKHSLTFGVSAERYESENVFFPGSQSVYVYNSLADFYTDANDYMANPNRTTSPIQLRRFQVRWSNIPGQEKPIQPLEVFYAGAYAQDVWQATPGLRITAGIRFDVPFFGDTGFQNSQVDGFNFRDEDGQTVRYSTDKLPDANVLISPRVGFNWDATGDRSTQIRGGTGIFTGRPAYVWISNQIGNNGVLTGFEQMDNTRNRPFHPDPNHYKPANVTGQPAASYELAFSDPDFKFPQIWRTNIAVDRRLPFGFSGTAEFLYNRDVNGIYYINANLATPSTSFSGADTRSRWTSGNRINSNISSAVVLKNQSEGTSWNIAGSLERPFGDGLFVKAGYSYGESKNTVDPSFIAFGSWNNNQHPGDPNNPGIGFSLNSPGHRVFLAASYRKEYLRFGATTLSLFWEGFNAGNLSYAFSGDLNGDGGTSNDLIYIHRNTSEMNFQQFTSGGVTYTAAQQAAAWDAYINQDKYLSKNRGRYAERSAVFLPMVYRADLSIAQELLTNVGGRRNSLQLRADILNVGNLINSDWGVAQRLVNAQPLIVPTSAQGGPADASGRAQYRLRVVDGELMNRSLEYTSGIGDVYRIQFGLTYTFN